MKGFYSYFSVALLASSAVAHSGHDQQPLSGETDWATRHLIEEHHISNFDPGAFFSLHDYDSSSTWTPAEIRRTYGLDDPSTASIPETKKQEVVTRTMEEWDENRDGVVDWGEFVGGWRDKGRRMRDFGTGVGHHGDDEYEYEIHHFEKFHDENTREEDLTHPEDIAHFAKHDREADEAERQQRLDQMPIVESNIPAKFRRNP